MPLPGLPVLAMHDFGEGTSVGFTIAQAVGSDRVNGYAVAALDSCAALLPYGPI
jgi:hypothetical protein